MHIRNRYVVLMLLLFIPAVLYAGNVGVGKVSALLTASSANYFPSSSGIEIGDHDGYFSYSILLEEETGNTPGATVTIEISMDKKDVLAASRTWDALTQTYIYPGDAAGTGSLAIADENEHTGSIHPPLCARFRVVVTETATDADVTCTFKWCEK
jgi:hypothetical protein